MNFGVTLLTVAVACMTGQTTPNAQGPQRFRVELPPRVESQPTHLLLRDVTVPSNQPIILRAYAIGVDSGKVYVGSTAIPGISPESRGATTQKELRINVTSGLRTWYAANRSASRVELEIVGVVPSDSTAKPSWSVRSVQLAHPE